MPTVAKSERQVGQLYGAFKRVLGPIAKVAWKVHVRGLENVPKTGPAILAPNHVSFLDSPFLMLALPRRITYVGKAEYMDSWKTKYLFPAVGMVPIDRSGGSASQRALDAAARILESGELFGIFPEGTRSRDGVLHRGHTGPARLALRTGAPIIPVGLRGTREIQPPEAKMPRLFGAAEINIGKPIDVGRYQDRADDRLVLRQIIDEVMFEIRELSGQDYVDTYATKKAETFPSEEQGHVVTLDEAAANGNGGDGGAPPKRSSAEVLGARRSG
jgi:1-acyl-sn-glycerol-3-phosphate acyltransferase